MRNSPLWRPQPTSSSDPDAPSDAPGKLQKASLLALGGLGLTLALGVGALTLFGFQDEALAPPALAEVATQAPEAQAEAPEGNSNLTRGESPVPTTHARLAATAIAPVETIDVAIAQTEFDVARLEEMTGMVPPEPAVGPDERAEVVAPPVTEPAAQEALADLRPGVAVPTEQTGGAVTDASAVESLPQDEANDAAETASIQPDQPAEAAEPPQASAAEPPARNLPALSAAKVNRYVNMRSGPADEASVVTVVPAGATVHAQSNCGWCLVTYQGKQGYVYKSFLGGQSASNERPRAPSAKPGLY